MTEPHHTPSSAPSTALTEPDGSGFAPWLRPSGSTLRDRDDTADWSSRERFMLKLADLDDRYGHWLIFAVGVLGALLIIWPAIKSVLS